MGPRYSGIYGFMPLWKAWLIGQVFPDRIVKCVESHNSQIQFWLDSILITIQSIADKLFIPLDSFHVPGFRIEESRRVSSYSLKSCNACEKYELQCFFPFTTIAAHSKCLGCILSPISIPWSIYSNSRWLHTEQSHQVSYHCTASYRDPWV